MNKMHWLKKLNGYQGLANFKKFNTVSAKEQLENVLNQQTNVIDPTSHTDLLNFEDMPSESEI